VKELSHRDRQEVFKQCNIDYQKRKTTHNVHHIFFKADKRNNLLPKSFDVNARSNLIPLPIEVHNALHKLVEETPDFRNNIESRVWLANYAYNGDLSDL
jgi:hypothetical protein